MSFACIARKARPRQRRGSQRQLGGPMYSGGFGLCVGMTILQWCLSDKGKHWPRIQSAAAPNITEQGERSNASRFINVQKHTFVHHCSQEHSSRFFFAFPCLRMRLVSVSKTCSRQAL